MSIRFFSLVKLRSLAFVAGLFGCLVAQGEVTHVEIVEKNAAYEGRSFGAVGPYEFIRAKVTIALTPSDRRNAAVVDLDRANRSAQGKVEATADLVLLRPVNPSLGNGTLLVEIPNRGRKLAPQLFDDIAQPAANRAAQASDAGIGFLQREGFSVAWIGWQADIASEPLQLSLTAPIAKGIEGPVRDEFQFDHLRDPATATLSATLANPAQVKVTVRANWWDARQSPADLHFRITGPQTLEISRPAGFDAGALYEVTYTGKDPIVLGMGYAATRDVVSFLKNDTSAINPLAHSGRVDVVRAIGFGVSQSGRFLRDFLWQGFNEDLQGRAVFEGLMPHVAGARRMHTNVRFGNPGRNARHPQDPAWTADTFPFTYAVLKDPVSGQTDGLLGKCFTSKTCPRIMQTDSEHEWWASRASLLVTDTEGNHIDLPTNVRVYMIAGTPHFADPFEKARSMPGAALPVNPLQSGVPMRALLHALQRWITDGTEPPASRVPMLAHGTLIDATQALPSTIPGLPYTALHTRASLSDFSPTAGLPPQELGTYPVWVPRADVDGMAIAGVRMIQLQVPKASYTGWNPRAVGHAPQNLFPLQGAVVPFAQSRTERLAAKDPRLSLEERYPTAQNYQQAVTLAARRMVRERLMLEEDLDRILLRAQQDSLAQLQDAASR